MSAAAVRDDLVARQSVVDVLLRVATMLDDRNWEALPGLFTEDAEAYGATGGLAAVEQVIRSHLGGCGPSQHLLSNHEVEVRGDRATARTKARVFHQGAGERSHLVWECFGDYHDELVRSDGRWRIRRRTFDVRAAIGEMSVLQPG